MKFMLRAAEPKGRGLLKVRVIVSSSADNLMSEGTKSAEECEMIGKGSESKTIRGFNPLVLRIQVLGQFFSPSKSGLY